MIKNRITSVGNGSPININWELVSHCQFNCTYCYYKPFKSNTDYKPLAKIVLSKLATLKERTKVTLLGGEPTLHPSFLEVVSQLSSFDHVEQICIVTNFEKPLSFWESLGPYAQKLKIVISFHPEYEQKLMFEKISKLQDSFTLDFVFIVHNDPQYLSKMQKTALQLEAVNERVSINYVKLHDKGESSDEYREYPIEILAFMHEQQEKLRNRTTTETVNIHTSEGSFKLPKFEMINQDLNRFQGWECNLRAFIIKENGQVASACTSRTKHILLADFSGSSLICPHQLCECDDYWEFPKTKT
jgi:sulfatase maturation enzyme AslB (radical SAM superfamily)